MARPTKYTAETVSDANYYLDNYEEVGDVVPTIAGLAAELKISRETVRDWAADKEKEEFSGIVTQIMVQQERKLVNGGLSGSSNPMITKLMLSKHGYSEKQEIDHQSSDKSMSPKGFNDFYDED